MTNDEMRPIFQRIENELKLSQLKLKARDTVGAIDHLKDVGKLSTGTIHLLSLIEIKAPNGGEMSGA